MFDLYKPLRNYLRNFNLLDSIYVIWAYLNNMQYEVNLPEDIQTDPSYHKSKHKYSVGMNEWEMETLLKEVLINAHDVNASKSFKVWHYLSKAMNMIKRLEENLSGIFITQQNVLVELSRLSHREFPWQSKVSSADLYRYYCLYNQDQINNILQVKTGLRLKDIYMIGICFAGLFMGKYLVQYPLTTELIEITDDKIDKFTNLFALDVNELKKRLLSEHSVDERYSYSYTSLRAFPLVFLIDDQKVELVCPSTTLLLWRITNGLYYEICSEPGFSNEYGSSFQDYIGKVLCTANIRNKMNIIAEHEYHISKNRKNTTDWMVFDDAAVLFVECKTKRMTLAAKSELLSEVSVKEDLNVIADAIIQLYKGIVDYKGGHYPACKYDSSKEIYPLVVTLEEWYFHDPKYNLEGIVKQKMNGEGLPLSLLTEAPYSICSCAEFENMVQVFEQTGIQPFMSKKTKLPEFRGHLFMTYISSNFANIKLKPIFDIDLVSILRS